MSRAGRLIVSITVGFVVCFGLFLFVFPSGCADVGGVPSWERCTTFFGTPAFSVEDWGWDSEMNVLVPVVAGVFVGILVWIGLVSAGGDDR